MTDPLLTAEGLTKNFGALTATDGVDLDVRPGEIHALIGPNGAGKTTLINQFVGEIKPDAGRLYFEGRDITSLPVHRRSLLGLARTFQITNILRGFSALDNVALAVQARCGHSFRFWQNARGLAILREPADTLLDRVGLNGNRDIPAAQLSHGERRLVGIAMALASRPKVLLMDEPMAGLDRVASRALMDVLQAIKGKQSILLVEHDMDAVFHLADRISVLFYGRVLATGKAEEIRRDPRVRDAYLGEEPRC